MDNIIQKEVILVDDTCRQFLIDRSNGSIRNMITNLEKLKIFSSDGVIISRGVCDKLCSTISFHQFELYITALQANNLQEAIRIIYELFDYGYSVIDILEYLFEYLKNNKTIDEEIRYKIAPFICDYISVFHNVHENDLELALFTRNILSVFQSPPL
jgi:DNA polymerase III gamma/tau subunit